MSRFYGTVRGTAKTTGSRQGNAASGITSTARGWDVGARVEARADGDADVIEVYATHGSHKDGNDIPVCEIRRDKDGPVRIILARGQRIHQPSE